jgi:two-component system, NarL family, nitrate/nitrite response regulator NarL
MAKAEIPTMVVGGSKLFREGLKKLLAQSRYFVGTECEELSQATALAEAKRPRLIIAVDPPKDEAAIRAAREAAPRIRFVVLSHNLSLEEFYSAMRAGVDAYLLDGISPDALIQALDLAMVGEKVLPTKLVGDIVSGRLLPMADDAELAKALSRLSEREVQALDCLIRGESNRTIAGKLGVSEATVKVTLKGILRKLGVANRTQAAVWALNHGFGMSPSPPSSAAEDE